MLSFSFALPFHPALLNIQHSSPLNAMRENPRRVYMKKIICFLALVNSTLGMRRRSFYKNLYNFSLIFFLIFSRHSSYFLFCSVLLTFLLLLLFTRKSPSSFSSLSLLLMTISLLFLHSSTNDTQNRLFFTLNGKSNFLRSSSLMQRRRRRLIPFMSNRSLLSLELKRERIRF
jgi:hypothetical protein